MEEMASSKVEGKILYQCVWCKRVFEKEKLSRVAETRCPYCGFNIVKKAKPFRAKLIVTSDLSKEQRILTGS
jgi:DNA-directed RNA polymerase subunit RPC12/RpoP